MRHIHILVPTYGRPREFVRLVASAQATCSDWNWTIYGLVEKDDPCLGEYNARMVRASGKGNTYLNVMQGKGSRNCIVEQWEKLKKVVPDKDIIFIPGDDVMFASFGWDEMIMKAMPENGVGLCTCVDNEVFDLLHMIIGVGLIKMVGYILYPKINHYYADSWWRKLGLDAEIIYPIAEMFLFHLHSKVKWTQLRATVTSAYKRNNDELKKDKAAFVASYPEIAGIVQKIKKLKIDQARKA